MKLGCILMASGKSRRFKQNKLLSVFNNKPIIEYIFSELPLEIFYKTVVVTAFPEICDLATSYGISSVFNPHSDLGASHTVKLGLDSIGDADGYMFCVCDQPLCSKDSFKNLHKHFIEKPSAIIALGYENKRGNPVIFPKSLFEELYNLKGDIGGRAVVSSHLNILEVIEATSSRELLDIDFEKDLEFLNHTS